MVKMKTTLTTIGYHSMII